MKNLEIKANIKIYNIEEADDLRQQLILKAQLATDTSYAPYSTFNVGCAVLLDNGHIISGSNQENAAYTNGLCAERTALFFANAEYPQSAVTMIAIAASTKGALVDQICSPCGSCRQVLIEVENRYKRDIIVIMTNKDLAYEVDTAKDLLPLSFGQDNLND